MHNLITRGIAFGYFKNKNSSNDESGSEETNSHNGSDSSNSSENLGKDGTNETSDNTDTTTTDNSNAGQWIDFCKIPLNQLELEVTDGVEVKRDLERGLWAKGTGSFFGRGIKFPRYAWKRENELPFSFVFTVRGENPSFLFGIGSTDINVNGLDDQALFSGEIQLFYDNGKFNRFFGGGRIRNWEQDTEANIKFKDDVFYKVVFTKSGKVGSLVNIYKVAKTDFDTHLETVGQYRILNNPADSELLIPYWNGVNTPDVFITAIKYSKHLFGRLHQTSFRNSLSI